MASNSQSNVASSVGAPPINFDNPNLYEHLSLIIDEFEKAALRSGDRQAMMITAQAPLSAMDQILASSDTALNMNRTASASRVSQTASTNGARTSSPEKAAGKQKNKKKGTTDEGWQYPGFRLAGSGLNEDDSEVKSEKWNQTHNDLEGVKRSSGFGINTTGFGDGVLGNNTIEIKEPSFVIGTKGSVGFDADINELLNGKPGGPQFGDWLKECLGCDLRLSFDWQLQPIDLILPVGDLINDINNLLDQFEGLLDPNSLMANLCDLLNGLNFLCIQDLLAILMALKMLLKSYLTFQLDIRLDWTLLLGPLLKMILDAIATLLQQLAGIVVAPLDCAYAALMSVSELQDALAETTALAGAVAARAGDRIDSLSSIGSEDGFPGFEDNTTNATSKFKDVKSQTFTTSGNQADGGKLPDVNIPGVSVSTSSDGGEAASKSKSFIGSFPTGFDITSDTKLPDAVKVPEFLKSNPFKKLALSVKEARDYIMDLVRKIIFALRSLEGLVAGSLGISLGNLGLILFIADMIRLVAMIIKLFSQFGGNVKDWCDFLRDNPETLEEFFPESRATVDRDIDVITLTRGPEVIAEINTCATGRTNEQAALMKKWIMDLKRTGIS